MNEQWINGSNPLRALFISVGLYDAFIHPPIHSLSTYARQPPCLAGDVRGTDTKMSSMSALPSQLQLSGLGRSSVKFISLLIATIRLFMPPREGRAESKVVKVGTLGVTIVILVTTS